MQSSSMISGAAKEVRDTGKACATPNLVQIEPQSRWVPSRFNARAVRPDGQTVLWNSFTGALTSFGAHHRNDLEESLSQSGFSGPLRGLRRYLHERGYLVRAEENQLRQAEVLINSQHFRNDILELILLASEDCNLRCEYCYEDFLRGTMQPWVREGIRRLVQNRIVNCREFTVGWFGGEPLFGFEAIEDLAPFFVQICEKYQVQFASHMTTNGYLLTPEIAGKLLLWNIRDFQITLDGTAEMHNRKRKGRGGQDTFDVIYGNLLSLKEQKETFSVTIRMNFDRENKDNLHELLELLGKSFAGDSRFVLKFQAIGQWGGPQDEHLEVCGFQEKKETLVLLSQSATANGLRMDEPFHDGASPGKQVCYAARPYNYLVGADGKIMKCTIVLDKKDYNVVGKLTADGSLEMDYDKYALWTHPAFASDGHCKACQLLPNCQGMHCPLIRIEEDKSPCPPMKRNLRNVLLDASKP
jgi:uncharacterized protein